MIKKCIIGLLLMLLGMSSIQAQKKQNCNPPKDSVIIMSESDLIDLIARIAKEKKKGDNYGRELRTKMLRAKFRKTIHDKYRKKEVNLNSKVDTEDYDSRFNRLEDQIRELMILVASNNKSKGNDSAKPIILDSDNPTTLENNVINNQNKKIEELRRELETLSAQEKNNNQSINPPREIIVKTDKNRGKDVSVLQKELNNLVEETKDLKEKIKSNKTEPLRKSKYDGVVKSIYFANNKANLSLNSEEVVNEVVNIMKDNQYLEVMIKGFASKVGSVAYNQALSLKRADNVKQALIVKGIAPGRVLTTYHGEDLSNQPAAEARRVDMIILDNRK